VSTPPAEPPRPDEFTTFMRAYQDMVFSTAARLTANDAQAEDIAQDVFVRAFEHFAQLRHSANAGGWLRTVARHLTLNYLTRHRRRWRLFSELRSFEDAVGTDEAGPEWLLGEAPMVETPLAELDGEQRRRSVDEALRQLPDHQRLPLVLYHFEELSYQQIAQQLRVSLAKVKTDMHRGRLALLAHFRSHGLAPSAGASGR